MKKISIAVISVLSIAAFTGCKKSGDGAGGGDCAGSIGGLMTRMKAEHDAKAGDKATPEQKKLGDDMMKGATDAMVKVCTEDKWSADVLKCFDDAKSKPDAKKCESQLTPEQQAHMKESEKAMVQNMMGKAMADQGSAMAAPPSTPPAGSATAPDGSAAAPAGSAAAPAGSAATPAAAPAGSAAGSAH